MQIRIHDPAQIGDIVKAARKADRLRQDVMASAIGVSENFLGKVERGNSSVYWDKLFLVLQELGIHVYLDITPEAKTALDVLQQKASASRKPDAGHVGSGNV